MTVMNCKICSMTSKEVFEQKILRKYKIKYFQCSECGFVFTEEPFWLKEAYDSPINVSDTGLLERNYFFAKKTSSLLLSFFDSKKKFLDYAGGFGVFTRLMRDKGLDFFWYDPFCKNLFAQGFEHKTQENKSYELLTAFESFEHFNNPKEEVERMLNLTDNILFSTHLIASPIPEPGNWWYYSFEGGQHIAFYTNKSLHKLAETFNLNYYSYGGLHLFSKKKLSQLNLHLVALLEKYGLIRIIKPGLKSRTQDDQKFIETLQSTK